MKVHMAIGSQNKFEPWIELSKRKFKEWQEVQTKPNFNRPYVLSFVYIRRNEWLFAGIYTVREYSRKDGLYWYSSALTTYYSEYIGRLVIGFEKNFRASYLLAEKYVEKMEIIQIFPEKYICDPFPGYANICISYDTLQQIHRTEEETWKTALSAVFGVYLITDTKTGKHYIGKADGGNAIWQRWSAYAMNGHGSNSELVAILKEKGPSYVENFQFSILEVITKSDNQAYIDARENYWKNALRTREFGYNHN
ncbi:GIY-YIG nuclease family protein [uncultured Sphaerochaeta sp.]|uniref:GIY-YIG nuclease family protein n=1 Tax=uncultured Sphaerochaeta sp. TaxID=886478 RepID=UPI0029C9F2CF|nr:GIY-YIG nuclease family protein [uncultured Sphaerochaeta sp.]